jgi:hypothetical protein
VKHDLLFPVASVQLMSNRQDQNHIFGEHASVLGDVHARAGGRRILFPVTRASK